MVSANGGLPALGSGDCDDNEMEEGVLGSRRTSFHFATRSDAEEIMANIDAMSLCNCCINLFYELTP